MKKNLYKEFQKERKTKEKYKDENLVIEKSKTLKTILTFLSDSVGKIIKLIFYVVIVALCSIGATYLFNCYLKGGIL